MNTRTHIMNIEGKELVFKIRGDMVDATLLGLPFGKKKHPLVWLKTMEAPLIATVIGVIKKCPPEDLVHIEGNDNDIRVWFDMGLAVSYAGWCFPPIKKWCADQIRKIEKRMDERMQQEKDENDDLPDGILIAIRHPGDLPC